MSAIGLKVKAHGGIAGGVILANGTEVIVVTDNAGSTEDAIRMLLPKGEAADRRKFHKVVIVQQGDLEFQAQRKRK